MAFASEASDWAGHRRILISPQLPGVNYVGGRAAFAARLAGNWGLLKKADRLRHNWFQRSRPDKLASYWAINDCCNC